MVWLRRANFPSRSTSLNFPLFLPLSVPYPPPPYYTKPPSFSLANSNFKIILSLLSQSLPFFSFLPPMLKSFPPSSSSRSWKCCFWHLRLRKRKCFRICFKSSLKRKQRFALFFLLLLAFFILLLLRLLLVSLFLLPFLIFSPPFF